MGRQMETLFISPSNFIFNYNLFLTIVFKAKEKKVLFKHFLGKREIKICVLIEIYLWMQIHWLKKYLFRTERFEYRIITAVSGI